MQDVEDFSFCMYASAGLLMLYIQTLKLLYGKGLLALLEQ